MYRVSYPQSLATAVYPNKNSRMHISHTNLDLSTNLSFTFEHSYQLQLEWSVLSVLQKFTHDFFLPLALQQNFSATKQNKTQPITVFSHDKPSTGTTLTLPEQFVLKAIRTVLTYNSYNAYI